MATPAFPSYFIRVMYCVSVVFQAYFMRSRVYGYTIATSVRRYLVAIRLYETALQPLNVYETALQPLNVGFLLDT